MKKKALILIGTVFIAATAMAGLYASGTWRYKMTVVVETPEGTKTGSAVREVSNSISSIRLDLPESTNPADIKGEAVVVDLGERGVLFALISSGSEHEMYSAFGKVAGSTTAEGIRYFNSIPIGTKRTLEDKKYWPRFVTFGSLDDPMSVKAVDPDDLAATFGEGVKLEEISLEITKEPVTWVIEKWLPEFNEEYWEWVKNLKYGDPRQIGYSNFKRGEK